MVVAGFGQHPNFTPPAEHIGKGKMKLFFQNRHRRFGALIGEAAHGQKPLVGAAVIGFTKQPMLAVFFKQHGVGIPVVGAVGHGGELPCSGFRQRLAGHKAPPADGVDLLVAHQLANKAQGRHMQSAVKLVHGSSCCA